MSRPDGRRFCRVAVDSAVLALDRPFDYRIPDRMLGRVRPGSVVRVRLHGRRMRAFVTDVLDDPAVPDPIQVSELVSEEPLFDAAGLALARWAANRYVASLGAVLHQAAPGRWSAPGTGVAEAPAAGPAAAKPRTCAAVTLTPEAEVEVVRAFVDEAMSRGGQALVIASRVAHAEALAAALSGSVLMHGDMRPSQRAAAWAASRDGVARVVVGGRAALFVPQLRPALVVVTQAHDPALKEERAPRLHGLVVARRRAELANATFLATSPVPPLELVAGSDVEWVSAGGAPDLKPEVVRPREGPVTARAAEAVGRALEQGDDALVFAPRRGYALRVRCPECGWYPRCPDCGLGLGAGAGGGLQCRGCGRAAAAPETCAECGGTRLGQVGWGSRRVASAFGKALPDAAVVHVDASEPAPDDRPRPALLVGTMAAAGAVRERLGAVVVADLDQLLGRPDFRAAERALGVLWDLAALLKPGGRFVVQTRQADHHTVQAFTRRSYKWFADRELPARREAGYPPYSEVVSIELVPERFDDLRAELSGARVIGPVPRRAGRVGALVRIADAGDVARRIRQFAAPGGVRTDVDPVDVQ